MRGAHKGKSQLVRHLARFCGWNVPLLYRAETPARHPQYSTPLEAHSVQVCLSDFEKAGPKGPRRTRGFHRRGSGSARRERPLSGGEDGQVALHATCNVPSEAGLCEGSMASLGGLCPACHGLQAGRHRTAMHLWPAPPWALAYTSSGPFSHVRDGLGD